MRCRLQSTRLLRSETAERRSTTSGPGRCRRSFEIFGFLKLSRDSALSPSSCAIDVIIYPVFVFSLIAKGKCRRHGRALSDGALTAETTARGFYSDLWATPLPFGGSRTI